MQPPHGHLGLHGFLLPGQSSESNSELESQWQSGFVLQQFLGGQRGGFGFSQELSQLHGWQLHLEQARRLKGHLHSTFLSHSHGMQLHFPHARKHMGHVVRGLHSSRGHSLGIQLDLPDTLKHGGHASADLDAVVDTELDAHGLQPPQGMISIYVYILFIIFFFHWLINIS